jgi:translation initiation factor 2 subunit 1
VTCYTYEGIDAIKESLLEGENTGTNESVVIKLIAPPMYVMTTVTLDREQGIQTLNAAIEKIATAIRAKGGTLDVKMAPKAITDREESEMQAMLDRLALEQEEVDGDDDPDA